MSPLTILRVQACQGGEQFVHRGGVPDRATICATTVMCPRSRGTRATGPPWWPVLAPIPELNVRTYVCVDGMPAVWFLSLDASSTFFAMVGRALYGMRYHVAEMSATERDGCVRFRSARAGGGFDATYMPASPAKNAERGSLEHFLVERYRLFSERRGRLISAVVAHEPWPLQRARARIDLNEMAPPGLELGGNPIVHFCRSVSAVISAPSPVGSVLGDVTRRRRARHPGRALLRARVEPERCTHVPADAA